MKKTIITIAAGVLAALAIAGPAEAASRSEAATRAANGIPSSVKYIKGTAFWVEEGTRCFQGLATERVLIQGEPVRAGRNVGYCTDGYVDRSKGESMTRFVVINPGR